MDAVINLKNEYNNVGWLNRDQLIDNSRLPKIVKLYKEYVNGLPNVSPTNDDSEIQIYGYVPDISREYISYPNLHPTKKMNENSAGRVIWYFELIIAGTRKETQKNVENMKTLLHNLHKSLQSILVQYKK